MSSCEKELYEDAITKNSTNGKIIIEDFSLKNKSEVINPSLLNATQNFKGFNASGPQNRMIYDSINNFYYDDTHGKHMQLDDKHSYTFPVLRNNNDGKIENLVFNQKQDGTFETFLVKYDVNETALDTLTELEFREKEVVIDKINTINFRICYCPIYLENPRYFRSVGTLAPVNNLFTVAWVECGCASAGGGGSSSGTDSGSESSSGSGSGSGTGTGSGSSGGGGAGGGSSSSTILTLPVTTNTDNNGVVDFDPNYTPCESLSRLADSTRGAGSIKSNVNRLKDHVNSTSNNVELGFSTRRNNTVEENVAYTNTDETSIANANIELPIGGSGIGGGHSHPANAYPMFSFGDVLWLLNAYDRTSSTRRSELFYMLVAKDNLTGLVNTYALKVANITTLANAVNDELSDPKYADLEDINDKIDKIHKDQAVFYKNCSGNFERAFLNRFPDFGVTLYKTNDPKLRNWNILTLSSVLTVTSEPCNQL